ncbi:MAG TPA: hypothetical protein VI197_09325 [Polyangiaceae bacterium]
MPKPIVAGRSLTAALVCAWCCHGTVAQAESARQAKLFPVAPKADRTLRVLRAADRDKDDRVDLTELKRFMEREVSRQVQKRMPKLDRNGDGRVTASEVPAMSRSRFARFDRDGDGAFTAQELSQVMRSQALARCEGILAALDVDRDGALTHNDVATERTRVARNAER